MISPTTPWLTMAYTTMPYRASASAVYGIKRVNLRRISTVIVGRKRP